MNLTPLFVWGIKMIRLPDNNELSAEEMEKVSFIRDCQDFIKEIYELLCTLDDIQKTVKNTGFNKTNVNDSKNLLKLLHGDISIKVSKMLSEYLKNTLSKYERGEDGYCSSDIT
jgi:hypothetical protein